MNNFKNKRIFNSLLNETAQKAKTIYYTTSSFIKINLPHSEVEENQYIYSNGDLQLVMTACGINSKLPYGSIPRLILIYIISEASKNRNSKTLTKEEMLEIKFGNSFTQFLKKLGLCTNAASRKRAREQLLRLLNTTISFQRYDKKLGFAECEQQFLISRSHQLWWNPKGKSDFSTNSKIILSQDFFEEITTNNVPVDLRALQILTRAPLQMDIYCWLTYKFSKLKKNNLISWKLLIQQFGMNYANDTDGRCNFKRKFKAALNKVLAVYPDANFDLTEKGLLLFPSNTHVPPCG